MSAVRSYGIGVEVTLTQRFIEFLHDSRLFSHQRPGVQRWQPGNPLRFSTVTEVEPYSAIYRGDFMLGMGAYSYMTIPVIGNFELQFTIGRYCSIGGGLRIIGNDHPTAGLSSSPIFYDLEPSWVKAALQDCSVSGFPPIDRPPGKGAPSTGHDVWFGGDVTLNHGVRIGNGAVVAAGSHVTKSVPDYAIVGGNPAKIIRYRFPDEIIAELQEIQFWRFNMRDLRQFNLQNISKFIHEFKAAGSQLEPWNPPKIHLWQSWKEIEGS